MSDSPNHPARFTTAERVQAGFYVMLALLAATLVVQVHLLGPIGLLTWACIAGSAFAIAAIGLYSRN